MADTPFVEAVAQLMNARKDFTEGKLSAVDYGRLRETTLGRALQALATEGNVRLQGPLYIDSQGDYRLVALTEDWCRPVRKAGRFGEVFSAQLNRYQPRTGFRPGATLLPENSWCYLNHFQAEKMVMDHYATKATDVREAPSQDPL